VAGFAGRARGRDLGSWAKAAASLLGIADAETLDAVRDEVREMLEQVARLRERELALAGGVSQLRARAARFEEALAGLARVQGKCVARLDAQTERAHELERLAARRDDHITRLIRDTAGQRAELERVHKEIGAMRPDADADDTQTTLRRELESLRTNVTQLENGYADVKKLNVGSTQRVIETLESIRDRVSKLEARAAEMSREARAKAGRMDALARHVAAVEGRLTTAIGKDGDAIVPVTKDADRPLTAAG
jgi:chromosome segregation ATPase